LAALAQLPEVDAVWLEGSLAAGRATPASDIDLRIALTDTAYIRLWEAERHRLLAGLGEYLLLEHTFARALTSEGVVVELWAYRSSELSTLTPHVWESLLCRLPGGTLPFRPVPHRSAAETWPDRRTLTVEEVRQLTNVFLMTLAECPAPLYSSQLHSAHFQLDDLRTELVKLMYRRLGIAYAKRFKHFSEVLPQAFLADLERTYMPGGAAPLDAGAMATAYVALFEVLGRHLQALADQAGGGFEPTWYWRLHHQISAKLSAFGRKSSPTQPEF
jgi:hypothetical protein